MGNQPSIRARKRQRTIPTPFPDEDYKHLRRAEEEESSESEDDPWSSKELKALHPPSFWTSRIPSPSRTPVSLVSIPRTRKSGSWLSLVPKVRWQKERLNQVLMLLREDMSAARLTQAVDLLWALGVCDTATVPELDRAFWSSQWDDFKTAIQIIKPNLISKEGGEAEEYYLHHRWQKAFIDSQEKTLGGTVDWTLAVFPHLNPEEAKSLFLCWKQPSLEIPCCYFFMYLRAVWVLKQHPLQDHRDVSDEIFDELVDLGIAGCTSELPLQNLAAKTFNNKKVVLKINALPFRKFELLLCHRKKELSRINYGHGGISSRSHVGGKGYNRFLRAIVVLLAYCVKQEVISVAQNMISAYLMSVQFEPRVFGRTWVLENTHDNGVKKWNRAVETASHFTMRAALQESAENWLSQRSLEERQQELNELLGIVTPASPTSPARFQSHVREGGSSE